MISQRVTEDSGNVSASEERNLRNISRHSRVLLERIPGTQGIWRVAPSYRLKTTETPHRRFSLSHAHHKLSAEYRQKGRLSVQNKSAGCVLSCTYTSGQQEVPTFCLRKNKVYQFRVLPFGLNTAPKVFTCLAHTVCSLPPLSEDFGNSVSR